MDRKPLPPLDVKDRRERDIPTEQHRRWDDCVIDPETNCCRGCGRPMDPDIYYSL